MTEVFPDDARFPDERLADGARFPADVEADLRAAGWQPGRDVSAAVRAWCNRTGIDREFRVFDAARIVLAEFGELEIPQRGPRGKPGGGFASRFYPAKYAPTTPEIHEFVPIIGVPVFPIGGNHDGPSHLVIEKLGRVFKLHGVADFFVGNTVNEAIIWMTRGGRLPIVDDDGHWLGRAHASRAGDALGTIEAGRCGRWSRWTAPSAR